jgi:RNA polymerase sigma-70 factor, ECF subfamily
MTPLTAANDIDPERDLLDALRRGEDVAYEQLVRAETGHLLAVARRILRNEQDAQDAVQQAFFSAFRALSRFNGACRLTTWLHRIVTNAALMKLRAHGHWHEESIEDLLPRFLEDGHHVRPFSEWNLPADARLLRQESAASVRAAIDRLPDRYRTVLLLRDIEDIDTAEVAAMLGVTPNAVKVRLHRARQALVTELEPVFGAPATALQPGEPASARRGRPARTGGDAQLLHPAS